MQGTEDEIAHALLDLLKDSVREHMIADVPVGVLLSGGVDSTAMLSSCRRADATGRQDIHGRLLRAGHYR